MRNLVYLSPVRWTDFAQRPHKFAEWHHATHGGKVLWLEPYPSRLPQLGDFARLASRPAPQPQPVPDWLESLPVPALPAEPLPGGTLVNRLLWRTVLRRVAAFARQAPCELVVGKPSRLAVHLLRRKPVFTRTAYDAMDDFPAFHTGLSSAVVRHSERLIAGAVDRVYVSSSRLQSKFQEVASAVVLVRNACDVGALAPLAHAGSQREAGVVGYLGTLASWFDWALVIALATARPDLRFRLVGPLHCRVPAALPANVELQGPCAHPQAMQEMARFAVGLIPFRRNVLTDAVDPVKYYEYRALGIPVLATRFGEMPQHAQEDPGVFLVDAVDGAGERLRQALAFETDSAWTAGFRDRNGWPARFSATS